jgi:hypothetical protein
MGDPRRCEHVWRETIFLPKFLTATLLILSFSFAAFPALGQNPSPAPMVTKGFYNGRFWKSLDSSSKLTFLAGYNNAATMQATLHAGNFENFKRITEEMLPSTLSGNEVSAALDRFYATPENAPIGIAWALIAISKRASGADEETIRIMISGFLEDTK